MNDNPPNSGRSPEDEIEARLVALLLDEADPAEKAALEAELAADPALAARQETLAFAADRIRETLTIEKSAESAAPPAPLRLSPERRRKVLAAQVPEKCRLIRVDFNHPLIPVAVAACFMLMLYTGYESFQPEYPRRPNPLDTVMNAPKEHEISMGGASGFSDEVVIYELNQLDKNRSSLEKEIARSSASKPIQAPNVVRVESFTKEQAQRVDSAKAEFKFNVPSAEPPPPPKLNLVSRGAVGAVVSLKVKADSVKIQEADDDEIFELSPFMVTANDDVGYRSTNTLSGTRLRTSLKDIGASTRVGEFGPRSKSRWQADNYRTLPFHSRDDAIEREEQDRQEERSKFKDVVTHEFTEDIGVLSSNTSLRYKKESAAAESPDYPLASVASDLLGRTDADQKGAGRIILSEAIADEAKPAPAAPNPTLQEYPEILTSQDALSTFSLNVSDVSYRLAQTSLNRGQLPGAGTLRAEEFINAFDYADPEALPGQSIAFAWDRARWSFGHGRDVLRFSFKTAATGRSAAQPLHLTLAIDASGSMARVDRQEIVDTALAALGAELTELDIVSVVSFGRESRLLIEGESGDAAELTSLSTEFNRQGGTDLEGGLDLAFETARRYWDPGAINRVILMTDGAANLGNVLAEELAKKVEANRRSGIALDCFGIGFDGHNDAFLERLSRNGDGRYHFLRSAEDARVELGEKLAGALRPAAFDVKVQIEFNPSRVKTYQQLGYQQHQLRDQDFRDKAVDAAELAAAEAGNALYLAQINPEGSGEIGVARARFRNAATGEYEERSWLIPYSERTSELAAAAPRLRLASVAFGFAAKLNQSPIAEGIAYRELLELGQDLQSHFPLEPRTAELRDLLLNARRLSAE